MTEKMRMPRVNIMMPVYNGMPLLRCSIESIRRQTYRNWECIICDDGSTDGTWEYLKEVLKASDGRFSLLRSKTNRGRGYSRQSILEQCNGKYICMLDAGDLMHPERIERQVRYLEEHEDVGLVSSAMLSFGTKTESLVYQGPKESEEREYDGVHFPNFAATMFRNPNGSGSEGEPTFHKGLRFCEDQHFLNQYLKVNGRYYYSAHTLYYYSEFDSGSKWKTLKGYWRNMITYAKESRWKMAVVCALKVVYSWVVFPFLSMDEILMRRGRPATEEEREEFERYGMVLMDVDGLVVD